MNSADPEAKRAAQARYRDRHREWLSAATRERARSYRAREREHYNEMARLRYAERHGSDGRRKRPAGVGRKKTSNPNRVTLMEIARLRAQADALLHELHPADIRKPKTRGDCLRMEEGPCPFVSCKYHLAIDVSRRPDAVSFVGRPPSIVENFPGFDVDQMPATCTLDVADEGGSTLDRVGEVLNLTRERVRQIEFEAMRKIKGLAKVRRLPILDWWGGA